MPDRPVRTRITRTAANGPDPASPHRPQASSLLPGLMMISTLPVILAFQLRSLLQAPIRISFEFVSLMLRLYTELILERSGSAAAGRQENATKLFLGVGPAGRSGRGRARRIRRSRTQSAQRIAAAHDGGPAASLASESHRGCRGLLRVAGPGGGLCGVVQRRGAHADSLADEPAAAGT